ncbi:50S ribosomal protein L10 [Candidatus Roizmanbacteria bacterium]|nr:50S ribosomal protein L10 [Candidatus Roizmanbacteria bacterium]
MVNTNKQSQLDKITSFLKNSSSFALIKFEKTTHTSLESLRKQLKKNDSKLMVIKNTILQKAINIISSSKESSHLRDLQKQTRNLKENTGLLGFGKDWSLGMNTFFAFSKADKTVGFKVGVLDKQTYGEESLLRIAQLPSRGELVGKLLGGMKSPTSHFVHALKFNMQKFVYILNARAKQTN